MSMTASRTRPIPALLLSALLTFTLKASAENAAPFTLPELPYASSALEPVIDQQTMEIHHGRHHRAYVDNLNAKVKDYPALADTPIEAVMAKISSYDAAVRNNGGGHYNHSLFWELMAAPGKTGEPSAEVQAAIEKDFGSMDAFRKAFSDAGAKQFGSGWAWLVRLDDGKLVVSSTANQDNPLMDVAAVRGMPLLAVDVWEHAYYLKYQNKRADYLSRWWEVVNWNAVNARFAAATGEKN